MFPHTPSDICDGFDWNALSAIGTLLAVAVALFLDPLRRTWNAPQIKIAIRKQDAVRERLETGLHAIPRLYVYNDGRGVGEHLRVTLTTIFVRKDEHLEIYDQPVSADLRWAEEENERVLTMLPSNASRLVNLGVLTKTTIGDQIRHFLVIDIPGQGQLRIGEGDYVFRIIISGANFKTRSVLITIQLGPRKDSKEKFWFGIKWPDSGLEREVRDVETSARLHASLR